MSRKTKKILVCVAAFMALVFTVALLSKATAGFDNLFRPDEWSLKEVNEDNLYQKLAVNAAVKNGIVADGADGVMIELDDDNRIKIDGTAEQDVTYALGTVTLPAGSYVFDSDINNGSKGSVYMSLMNGEAVVAEGYRGEVAFVLSTECTLTVTITVKAETDVNKTLEPIICVGTTGDDLISFWK